MRAAQSIRICDRGAPAAFAAVTSLCPLRLFPSGSELRFIWPNFAFGSVKLKKLYWRSVINDEGDCNTRGWTVRLYQYFLARDDSPNVIDDKRHVRHGLD